MSVIPGTSLREISRAARFPSLKCYGDMLQNILAVIPDPRDDIFNDPLLAPSPLFTAPAALGTGLIRYQDSSSYKRYVLRDIFFVIFHRRKDNRVNSSGEADLYDNGDEGRFERMNPAWRIVSLVILLMVCTACVGRSSTSAISITNLDPGDIPMDTVGNFDIYTQSFEIANPTNLTFENVDIEIMLMPTAAYCHGQTKAFSIPTLFPRMKKTVQVSIAEFSGLDCQYNYTYQVFTGGRY